MPANISIADIRNCIADVKRLQGTSWILHIDKLRCIPYPILSQKKLSFNGLYGNLLAILSGMLGAVMILCMRRQKGGIPGNTILLGNILGALIG
jgi:hypothetical protein